MKEVLEQFADFISRMVGGILEFVLSGKTLSLLYSLRIYMLAVIGALAAVSLISKKLGYMYFISWQSLLIAEAFVGVICLCHYISKKVNMPKKHKPNESDATE